MNMAERIARLDKFIADRTLVRKEWGDGQERACLLVALSPEVARAERANACPADVMPQWLANLVPALDDNGSTGAWYGMVERFASLARLWKKLDAKAWERLDYKFRAIAVCEARTFVNATEFDVHKAVDDVLTLLDKASRLENVTKKEWAAAAGEAARTAASAAARTAWGARAAAWAAADAAARTAEVAADAADWAAYAAAAADAADAAEAWAAAAATWAAEVARAAAWDRMTVKLFDAIESEIKAA